MKVLSKITISEPFEFDIPGKGNVLFGEIRGLCYPPNKKNWQKEDVLIDLNEEIVWENFIIKQILVSPRYKGSTIEDILGGKSVTIGISRIKHGIMLKAKDSYTEDQVEYFAIGSIEQI